MHARIIYAKDSRCNTRGRWEKIDHIGLCVRYVRVIVVPEAFCKRVVIYLQLCDLKPTGKKNNENSA